MKKHAHTILTIATILACTVLLTLQQDQAQDDRARLFSDLVTQAWKIQADVNGVWEELPSGQLRRSLPEETDPSVRQYLIDAAERDESMRQLLVDIAARLDKLERR